MKKPSLFFLILIIFLLFSAPAALACDACGCTLSRVNCNMDMGQNQPWFFDFTVEQQNWRRKDAASANALIEEGHDFHDKTHEEFYHFMLGAKPTERLSFIGEIPYVVREAIEVEDADNLGRGQRSEGWGDLSLFAVYKVWVEGGDFAGLSAGVKLPTGSTGERNFQGELFEIELQPGSGSYDYPLGFVYRRTLGAVTLSGNVSYVVKTQGAREFEYGDLVYASLNADAPVNPKSAVPVRAGVAMTFQHEQKQIDHGVTTADSGETSFFLGPEVNVKANDTLSVFAQILFPAYQVTGGVHQKLENIWSAGVKLVW